MRREKEEKTSRCLRVKATRFQSWTWITRSKVPRPIGSCQATTPFTPSTARRFSRSHREQKPTSPETATLASARHQFGSQCERQTRHADRSTSDQAHPAREPRAPCPASIPCQHMRDVGRGRTKLAVRCELLCHCLPTVPLLPAVGLSLSHRRNTRPSVTWSGTVGRPCHNREGVPFLQTP